LIKPADDHFCAISKLELATMLDSRFANPKLAEIAESFQVKPGKGFGHSLVIELGAYLWIVVALIVSAIIVFLFTLPSTFLRILFNAIGIKADAYLLIVIVVSYPASYYICYSFIAKYFFRIKREAKRVRVNALAALSKRSEDPVLYLRSFADDKRVNPISRGQKTYEEDLALALNSFGPVIAIGSPQESDTPLGATRIYLKHENWQENVRRLMQISQLIVIQAGTSEGILWEFEAALEGVDPSKMIISFLPWYHLDEATREGEYQRFRRHVDDFMNRSPSAVTIKLPEYGGNALILIFSKNWTPELIGISKWKKWFYRFSSSLSVTGALRPALKGRKLKLSWWKNVSYLIFVCWLIFGFAWTIYRFPNILFSNWKESQLVFWFNFSLNVAGVIVVGWSVANLFLFIFRRLANLIR
jgi:hypothetical protein